MRHVQCIASFPVHKAQSLLAIPLGHSPGAPLKTCSCQVYAALGIGGSQCSSNSISGGLWGLHGLIVNRQQTWAGSWAEAHPWHSHESCSSKDLETTSTPFTETILSLKHCDLICIVTNGTPLVQVVERQSWGFRLLLVGYELG